MVFRRVLILLLITGLIGGCALSQKINNVKLGMLKSEVIQVMGEPNYVASRDDVEILSYRLWAGSLVIDEYIVRVRNGKVDLFGKRFDFGSLY